MIETAILVLVVLAVLGYASMEYKYLENGAPVLLLGLSIMSVVMWQVDLLEIRLMWIMFGIHGIGIAILVVLEEAL